MRSGPLAALIVWHYVRSFETLRDSPACQPHDTPFKSSKLSRFSNSTVRYSSAAITWLFVLHMNANSKCTRHRKCTGDHFSWLPLSRHQPIFCSKLFAFTFSISSKEVSCASRINSRTAGVWCLTLAENEGIRRNRGQGRRSCLPCFDFPSVSWFLILDIYMDLLPGCIWTLTRF